MAMLTLRRLPEEMHRALRVRAILEEAVRPESRIRLGSLLADLSRQAKLTDEDFTAFAQRETTAAEPMTFER